MDCKCGKEIEQPNRGPRATVCRDCGVRSGVYYITKYGEWAKRQKPKVANVAVCKACGSEFPRIGVGTKRCDECIQKRKHRQQLCTHCGDVFPARSVQKGFCSTKCVKAHLTSTPSWLVCPCGEVFLNAGLNRGRCWGCRVKASRRNNCKGNARRRARQAVAEYERVDRFAVFERDGWKCQLCGDLVDREAEPRTPMSATLDHVVPVSKGGAHTMDNLQCAHCRCNLQKANRHPGEGARLFSTA